MSAPELDHASIKVSGAHTKRAISPRTTNALPTLFSLLVLRMETGGTGRPSHRLLGIRLVLMLQGIATSSGRASSCVNSCAIPSAHPWT